MEVTPEQIPTVVDLLASAMAVEAICYLNRVGELSFAQAWMACSPSLNTIEAHNPTRPRSLPTR